MNFCCIFLYPAHRKKTFPQSYTPLKAGRSMNRQTSKESSTTLTRKESGEAPASPASASDSDGGGYGNDTVSRPSNFSSYADYTSRDVSEDIEDEEPPPLSERVATYHDEVSFYCHQLKALKSNDHCSPSSFRKAQKKFSSTRERELKSLTKMKKISKGEKSK